MSREMCVSDLKTLNTANTTRFGTENAARCFAASIANIRISLRCGRAEPGAVESASLELPQPVLRGLVSLRVMDSEQPAGAHRRRVEVVSGGQPDVDDRH